MNKLFLKFDNLVEKHGLEKIKTVGDAYMVAGGLGANPLGHLTNMAALALDMIDTAQGYFSQNRI